MKMTKERANKVYDILEKHAGASASERFDFVFEMTSKNPTPEWRFRGVFGFGGKYRSGKNTIDYYREDQTKELDKVEENVNQLLEQL